MSGGLWSRDMDFAILCKELRGETTLRKNLYLILTAKFVSDTANICITTYMVITGMSNICVCIHDDGF